MNVQKYPVAPEAAAERMVLGRMVLRIEDSGMAVSEGTATYGDVSGKEAHPPAAPDENPFQRGDGANGFYLSKSRVNRYIACPRSYLLHYDLGIVPLRPDRDLLIGRSTHRLIAAHHLARKKEEFVDANAVLDGVWSRYMQGDEAPEARQEMEAARTESLQYAQLFLRDVPLDPLEIERDFSLPLVDLENGDTLPVPLVGVIDLVDHFSAEEKPDTELFELLQTFLALIEEGDTSERLLRFFEIRHLKLSGYAPALDRCILCNAPLDSQQRYVFSITQGGLHCRSCSSKQAASDALPISLGTIKTLLLGREIEAGKMKRILFSGQTARESKSLLSLFIGHILGKELKSLKILNEIQSMGG